MPTKQDTVWAKIRGFFETALGPEIEEDPAERKPLDPLESLLGPLDTLRRQVTEAPQEEVSAALRGESQRDDELAYRKTLFKEELLELHRRLQTGLEQVDLESMSRSIKWHCHAFRSPRPDELHELAMLAVMARLHHEALEQGWEELHTRLSEAELAWPEPTGLTPRADPEQVARHRTLHAQELKESFVAGSFARLAHLIVGEVPAWGELTPEPQGAVWIESLYEATAGALAYRRLQEMENLMNQEQGPLKARLAEALSSALQSIQQQLATGVSSVSQARRLSDLAVTTSQEVAADVVWAYLQERL